MAPYLSACDSENGSSRLISGAASAGAPRRWRMLLSTSATLTSAISPKADSAPTSACGARMSSSVALRATMAVVASRMPR